MIIAPVDSCVGPGYVRMTVIWDIVAALFSNEWPLFTFVRIWTNVFAVVFFPHHVIFCERLSIFRISFCCCIYLQPSGMIKCRCQPIHAFKNVWLRFNVAICSHQADSPLDVSTVCLIWWCVIFWVKWCQPWYWIFILRPAVIKQH